MLDLLCIGEAMAELRRDQSGGFAVGFAGDTYNTAVYAQRALGAEGAVGFMSRIGLDPLSAGLRRAAEAENLDTRALSSDPGRNIGVYSVATDEAGERSFHYWRDQSAARSLFQDPADLSLIPPARVLYLSGISMAILSPQARDRLIEHLAGLKGECKIAYDSNYRPKLWEDKTSARAITERMWDLADLAFPSLDDEMALFDETSEDTVIRRFERGNFSRCTIKRAHRGPLSLTLEGPPPRFAAARKVIDTTAAGDSFNGGYLAAYLAGHGEASCLSAGHELAAHVVGQPGAIAPR